MAATRPVAPANPLTHRVGPLPVWGWIGLAVVGFLLYRRYEANKSSASATSASSTGTTGTASSPFWSYGSGSGGGGGGGDSSGSSSTGGSSSSSGSSSPGSTNSPTPGSGGNSTPDVTAILNSIDPSFLSNVTAANAALEAGVGNPGSGNPTGGGYSTTPLGTGPGFGYVAGSGDSQGYFYGSQSGLLNAVAEEQQTGVASGTYFSPNTLSILEGVAANTSGQYTPAQVASAQNSLKTGASSTAVIPTPAPT